MGGGCEEERNLILSDPDDVVDITLSQSQSKIGWFHLIMARGLCKMNEFSSELEMCMGM